MALKISYRNTTSPLLLVFLLTLHCSNLCHAAEEDSQCRFLDSDLSNNSVKVGDGVGIPFIKSTRGRCGSRRSSISPEGMNPLVAALATVALFAISVAVSAHVCSKSLNIQWLHIDSIHLHMSLLASILLNPSAMDEFEEYDIMSRRRIRSRGNNLPKAY